MRKAKSLVSFHISGNNLDIESLIFIRDSLKIVIDEKRENPTINNCMEKLGKHNNIDEIEELRFYTPEVKYKLKY